MHPIKEKAKKINILHSLKQGIHCGLKRHLQKPSSAIYIV